LYGSRPGLLADLASKIFDLSENNFTWNSFYRVISLFNFLHKIINIKIMRFLKQIFILTIILVSVPGLFANNGDGKANDSIKTAKDIVALAVDTDILATLVEAVKAGELVETLQGDGPFTVFAPTNEAFSKLPEGTLENLLKPENKDQLVQILTYHVIPGKIMSSDLSDGMAAETVNGAPVEIGVNSSGVTINKANVLKADIEASNGVVHVIDQVILPPTR
jgi:uncharacterized surface protein with fasciclin (FAS1) repeats